jgi:hypothetical protein
MMADPVCECGFSVGLRIDSSGRPDAVCAGTLLCFYLDGIEQVRTEKSHG